MSTPLYRIANWEKIYEKNRTREIKNLLWVPIPINHDSDGYCLLMEQPNGPALFGAWIAIVKVAANCDPRGTLLRRGGEPHNSTSLNRITRIPASLFEQLFKICTSSECKWLEIQHLHQSKPETATIPHPPAVLPHQGETIQYSTVQDSTKEERESVRERETSYSQVIDNPSRPTAKPPSTIPPISKPDLLKLADLRGISQDCAEWFWNTHDARNWTDATGQPISKVEPLLLNAWIKWQQKIAQAKAHSNTSLLPHVPQPTPSKSDDIKNQTELKRVEARLNEIREQATHTATGVSFSPQQKLELATLKSKRNLLLKALNFAA